MKALIEYIARYLAEYPEQVEVRTRRAGRRVLVELRVAKPDMGRVIGRHGRVANAMRALLRVAAERENKLASLDILEP